MRRVVENLNYIIFVRSGAILRTRELCHIGHLFFDFSLTHFETSTFIELSGMQEEITYRKEIVDFLNTFQLISIYQNSDQSSKRNMSEAHARVLQWEQNFYSHSCDCSVYIWIYSTFFKISF